MPKICVCIYFRYFPPLPPPHFHKKLAEKCSGQNFLQKTLLCFLIRHTFRLLQNVEDWQSAKPIIGLNCIRVPM